MGKSLTYKYVKLKFEELGYTLTSTTYTGRSCKLHYICPEGHEHFTTWHSFNQHKSCKICNIERRSGTGSHSWKGGVYKKDLPLFETYASKLEKCQSVHLIQQEGLCLLGVECSLCSKIFVPTASQVIQRANSLEGKRLGESNLYCSEECKDKCATYNQKLWPKNHKPYKNDRPGQKQWADMVKHRDNYTCQNCGTTEGPMIVHHIDPVINNPVESMDVDNGKTLCRTCDKKAHQTPGCTTGELRC